MTSALVPISARGAAGVLPRPSADPGDLAEAHRPPRIRAVCLDIDDTLVDFTSSARRALFDLIGRDDMWTRWQHTTDEFVAMVVAGELPYDLMHRARTKAFFADLGALLDDDLVAVLEERRRHQLNSAWRLFDDALPCLDWLRAAGLRLAAVTNASGRHQLAKLAGLGIERFFDTVVIAGELGAAKPDPVIFHTACERLDVPVDETVHVGDLLEVDAVGARDAGLHGVWLDRTGRGTAPTCGLPRVETLADLPELLVSEYLTPDARAESALPEQRGQEPVSAPEPAWSNISHRR
jgi:putative hydrolase of the HAD superfamily